MAADISILLPACNEGARIAPTIHSFARARTTGARLEFIVVDDASADDSMLRLKQAVPLLLQERAIDIRVVMLEERSGNYHARNEAARFATAPILFITDAHVEASVGWDELVLRHLGPNRILTGAITEPGTSFHGYGCRLLFPIMGTSWVRSQEAELAPVEIAPCSCTILYRSLFESLGGYDPGMLVYSGGEPEFSVRAWLAGCEIVSMRDLKLAHQFKPRAQLSGYLKSIRHYRTHNNIRFALLYLGESGCLQVLRHYARTQAETLQHALRMVHASNVWERREQLDATGREPFPAYVQRFQLGSSFETASHPAPELAAHLLGMGAAS